MKIIVPTIVSKPPKPILLVTSVIGKAMALPGEKVKYEVTGYNLSLQQQAMNNIS